MILLCLRDVRKGLFGKFFLIFQVYEGFCNLPHRFACFPVKFRLMQMERINFEAVETLFEGRFAVNGVRCAARYETGS